MLRFTLTMNKPTLGSHIHLQFAQANIQSKPSGNPILQ